MKETLEQLIAEQAKDAKSRHVSRDAREVSVDPLSLDRMEIKDEPDKYIHSHIPKAKPDIHKRAGSYRE